MGTVKKNLIDIVPEALAPPGTKGSRLLGALLRGEKITPQAAVDYNMTTVHARAAELRRAGWPVETMKLEHPRYPKETYPVYYFLDHFIRWCKEQAAAGIPVDPRRYNYNGGRGKFKVK